jgi:hypothetical protein
MLAAGLEKNERRKEAPRTSASPLHSFYKSRCYVPAGHCKCSKEPYPKMFTFFSTLITGVFVMLIELLNAPEGYEDADGFHLLRRK